MQEVGSIAVAPRSADGNFLSDRESPVSNGSVTVWNIHHPQLQNGSAHTGCGAGGGSVPDMLEISISRSSILWGLITVLK